MGIRCKCGCTWFRFGRCMDCDEPIAGSIEGMTEWMRDIERRLEKLEDEPKEA